MNLQKALPVITSIAIILLVAFLRDRSKTLAVILSTMPINITLGLWVIFGTGEYNQQTATQYVRALLPGLSATMVWIVVVWLLVRFGVNLLPAVIGGYAVWNRVDLPLHPTWLDCGEPMTLPHATLPDWQNAGDNERLDKLRLMVEDLYRYQLAMHVERVIEVLEAHPCADDKERDDVQRIIELARLEHPNIFSPLCEVGHITGSALVVHPPTQRVLLNHHRKFDRWMQFGGHMDNDLAPHVTALREAREESGLSDVRILDATHLRAERRCAPYLTPRPFDVDIHLVPQRADRPEHLHLDLRYLLATDAPDAIAASDESLDVRWFTLTELEVLNLEPGVWRMIRKAQQMIP